MGTLLHSFISPGMKTGTATWKTIWRFLKKLKIKLAYDPATVFWVYMQRNANLKRYMHSNVHSSIIYNRQDMAAT